MARTAIIFTPKYYEHDTGPDHPEVSRRLKVIMKEMENANLFSTINNCQLVEPDSAQIEDLELVHVPDYVRLVKRVCDQGGGLLDLGDTVVSPESFEVARYAAGGALKAVDVVLNGKARNALALVRPPGHHAGAYYGAGFCVFNNTAIAAAYLTKKCGFNRVLVVDIDAHHGNGTQEIFYDTAKVLYISLHEDPLEFPGTGFIDEIGEGNGLGYNVNVPFPYRTGENAYLKAVNEIVEPIAQHYKPQFILLSVGYDGYYADPVGKLNLSIRTYASTFEKILHLASTLCEDKLTAVLEGGYNLKRLGKLVLSSVSKMANFAYQVEEENPPRRLKADSRAERVLEEVKRVHAAFWNL